MNPLLEEKKLDTNGFKILGMKYGIDKDYKINLLEIDIDPDLSIEIDKSHKMKLHYWIFFDILNKFVFKNNLHHRWEKCEENMKMLENNNLKINEPKRYLVNTSRILKDVLNKNGYIEGNVEKYCDFSSWDSYNTKNIKSEISIISRRISYKMDDKIIFYKTLLENNIDIYCPKTYLTFNDINYDPKKIYFLKNSGSSGGRGVHVVNSLTTINDIISSKPGNYLLQEEVANLKLIDKKKFTLRCYILLTDKKEIFIHKNILCIHHSSDYSSELDRSVHIDHKVHKYSNYSDEEVFMQLQDLFFNVCTPFIKNESFENQYIILGADILLDNDNKPYIIEINTYPNMQYDDKKVEYVIKKEMFSDFVNLYVNPKIKKTTPTYGKWCLCNPLFEDTHFQFKFKEVYLENLFKNMKDYDYNLHNSRLVSLNYWSKIKFNNRHIRYMNKNFICVSDCKKQFYQFLKSNNIDNLTPRSYLSINDITDKTGKFYIKTNTGCARKGVFCLSYDNLVEKEREFLNQNIQYIIQDNVKDPLLYNNKKVIFGTWVYMTYNNYYIHNNIDITHEQDEYMLFKRNVTLIINQSSEDIYLENYEVIKKNILDTCDKFMSVYHNYYIENFNKNKNEMGYCRFDIIVDNTYKPYIIEVNSSGAGNSQDSRICKNFFINMFDSIKNNMFNF